MKSLKSLALPRLKAGKFKRSSRSCAISHNVPHIFDSVAKFATRHTSTQAEIADTYSIILECIREVVPSLSHRTYKHTDALLGTEFSNIVFGADDLRVEAQRDLAAIRWKMIGDRVLDDFEQLLLGVQRSYRQLMQQLHHEASESLERARDTDSRIYLDQHTFGCMDEDLQLAGFVHRRVKERQKALEWL